MSIQAKVIQDPRDLKPQQQLRFYAIIAMLFVSLLLIVNIITQKIVHIGSGLMLTAGDFIYPLTYLLSILLTEVYGYAMSRRVVWGAFFCNILVAVIIVFSIALPDAGSWHDQSHFKIVLGRAPKILIASLSAFLIGEFIGTYILSKIKVFTEGRYLWFRFMSATMAGQLIDSVIFTVIAFVGIIAWQDVIVLSISAYLCKVIFQILMTPIIYVSVKFLKKHEHIDIFDRNTNFNPFNLGLQ